MMKKLLTNRLSVLAVVVAITAVSGVYLSSCKKKTEAKAPSLSLKSLYIRTGGRLESGKDTFTTTNAGFGTDTLSSQLQSAGDPANLEFDSSLFNGVTGGQNDLVLFTFAAESGSDVTIKKTEKKGNGSDTTAFAIGLGKTEETNKVKEVKMDSTSTASVTLKDADIVILQSKVTYEKLKKLIADGGNVTLVLSATKNGKTTTKTVALKGKRTSSS